MKLGILTASISRQAGGLFWSVKSLAGSVHDMGCDLHVFAGADQYSSRDMKAWGEIPLTIFSVFGPVKFGYQIGLSRALSNARLDLAHIHGLWTYPSYATKKMRKRNIPYLISPHGMLDPWAVRHSNWKKRLVSLFYENAHLRGAVCIHALCKSEYESIRAYGLTNPVAVIPNGVDLPKLETSLPVPKWAVALPADSKILFFLGRLHPKKGLVNLLHALAKAKNKNFSVAEPWHLVIAGWEQGGHQVELERLAADLEIEEGVHFIGPQYNNEKATSFMHADVFILPSFSEGLPMAVLEAWSYGLPVLMTPQCNIPEGFKAGAALKIQSEVESIEEGLCNLFEKSDKERQQMGKNGLNLVKEKFTWDRAAKDMYLVYDWILGGRVSPSCVITD